MNGFALRRFFTLAALLLLVFGVRWLADAGSLGGGVAGLDVASPLALGVVLLAAYLAGGIAADIGLPRITGYLLGGLLIGPSVVGLVTDAEIEQLRFVDDVAIALIAFSAGAELRIADVREQGRSIAAILVFEMIAVFVLVAGTMLVLRDIFPIMSGRGFGDVVVIALVFGSIAIANSPSVAVAVINDTRARGPVASTILGVTVLKDVAVILFFAVMLAVAKSVLDGGGDATGLAGKLAWEIGGSIAIGTFVGWLVTLWMDRFRTRPVLFVLGVAVVLAGMGDALHLEVLLMALATGFFVENVSHMRAEPFVHAVEANSVPFYAIFFALAGAGIHLDALGGVWHLVLLLVSIRAFAIWLGTRTGARVGGAPEAVRRHAWTGFVSQAGVTLGMVTIAAEAFPVWGSEMKMLFVAMVAVHELGGPILLQKGLEAAGETHRETWPEDEDEGGAPGHLPHVRRTHEVR